MRKPPRRDRLVNMRKEKKKARRVKDKEDSDTKRDQHGEGDTTVLTNGEKTGIRIVT